MSGRGINQARQEWPVHGDGAEIVVFPLRTAEVQPEFGRRAQRAPFSLIVDLSGEEIGPRWWRGVATLAALCASAFLLSPGFEPLAGKLAPPPPQYDSSAFGAFAPMPLAAAGRDPAALPLPKGIIKGERDGALRVSGDIPDGLYWALRGGGLSPALAAAYLRAIATRIDVGEVTPFDRFEYIIDSRSGGDASGLLYAGLHRAQGGDVELVRWASGGRSGWVDANAKPQSSSSGLMAPVAGHITSGFGSRVHPILRFTRFHSGVDFGARWGSPIVAAADGQVVGAGIAGGYGRQVRIAHGGGIVTTYSHMSSMAASPGMPVRQGQVIGYVGSSGLSTGPHLHFEVRVGGQAVNPLSARLISRPVLDRQQLAAFKARVKQLLSIPTKPQA